MTSTDLEPYPTTEATTEPLAPTVETGSKAQKIRVDVSIPAESGAPGDEEPVKDLCGIRTSLLADYMTASGPLRAEPPPVVKWPKRSDSVSESKRKLQDNTMLLEAARRSGSLRNEANAQFSLGVLEDNLGNIKKAISHYRAFLTMMTQFQDDAAAAIGYNCLGVDYQLLGPKFDREALTCHEQHEKLLERAADIDGKFICHTNLGLLYLNQGQTELAKTHHEAALRYAIQSNSDPARAIAISNIGLSNVLKGDHVAARACMTAYLDLCHTHKDITGQARAFLNLGGITALQEQPETAKTFYEQAIRAAQYIGDGRLENQAKVSLGIVLGKTRLNKLHSQMARE